MTAWKAGDRCTVEGFPERGTCLLLVDPDRRGWVPITDRNGYHWVQSLEALRPIPETPPVDPSKVTVDAADLWLVSNVAASTYIPDSAKPVALAVDRVRAALGVVSPDPTSDEAIGVCEACEAHGTRYDDEGTILCESCWQERTEPLPSPVAVEAAPPTPAAWLLEFPSGLQFPFLTREDAIQAGRYKFDASLVPLFALGEGQAIVNTAKLTHELVNGYAEALPIGNWTWAAHEKALRAAIDAAFAAASEATP